MKQTKKAVLFLLLSLITFSTTLFAWVNISKVNNTGDIPGDVSNFTDIVTFYVKRKDTEDYVEINTIRDMHTVFGDTSPGETYEFKIIIRNDTDEPRTVITEIQDIWTTYRVGKEEYDLRNVFYIEDGKVNISEYDLADNLIERRDPFLLVPKSNEPTVAFGQELSLYRLNNLIKFNNPTNDKVNILQLTPILEVDEGVKIVVNFILVYDPTTEDISYQDNMLNFYGIFIRGL